MTTSEKLSAGMLILVLGVLGASWWQDHRAGSAIPAPTVKTIDSLEATAPVFDSVVTTNLAEADRRAEVDRRLARRERALRALADTLRARKDSLALDASQHPDSALAWRTAFVVSDSEAAALRTVIDTLHARVDTLTAARDSLRAVVTVTLARLDVASGVVVDLRAALIKATECQWGGPLGLPCPSRRVSFVGGLAIMGAAAVASR